MDFSVPLQEVPRSTPLGVLIKNASKIVGQPFILYLCSSPLPTNGTQPWSSCNIWWPDILPKDILPNTMVENYTVEK
jgi:hypothetical protein